MKETCKTRKSPDLLISEVAKICNCSTKTVSRAVKKEKGYNEDVYKTYIRLKEGLEQSKQEAKRLLETN